ncbi:hypothetical protein BOTBODRAFT_38096 [Botryobasidium botryosum FD-172 SS1]|uniref:phosphatidate phosphatase n=1 Tax=Botryobasidium botryosum (strain FD-172 SS1) TaxID=930990 RepID=A0A067LYE6_BOTB1|nr:hypothetical protein BOTBODRAFT_38096 [Botryobasidium botryosum FD-172 SS1]
MNYLRGALSAASQYYKDINPSTLTGAIDVIVVQRPTDDGDAELICSPFHVRFGKLQVFHPADKKVTVEINGHSIPFDMKIGDAGEAFFVFETDQDVPEELITSPILGPVQTDSDIKSLPGDKKDSSLASPEKSKGYLDPPFLDLTASRSASPSPSSDFSPNHPHDHDTPPTSTPTSLSDGEPLTQPDSKPSKPSKPAKASIITPSSVLKGKKSLTDAVVGHGLGVTQGAYRALAKRIVDDDMNAEQNGDGEADLSDAEEGKRLASISNKLAPNVVYNKDLVYDMSGYHSGKKGEVESDSDDDGSETEGSLAGRHVKSEEHLPSDHSERGPDEEHHGKTQSTPTLILSRGESAPPESTADSQSQGEISWEWGGFPTPAVSHRTFSFQEGEPGRSASLPPDLEAGLTSAQDQSQNEPQREAQFRAQTDSHIQSQSQSQDSQKDKDGETSEDKSREFGQGGVLTPDAHDDTLFWVAIEGRKISFQLSLCGPLGGKEMVVDGEAFDRSVVRWEEFLKDESVVGSADLALKWDGSDRAVSRQDASPLFPALVTWREAALNPTTSLLPTNNNNASATSANTNNSVNANTKSISNSGSSTPSGWSRWWSRNRTDRQLNVSESSTDTARPQLQITSSAPPELEAAQSSERPASPPTPSPHTKHYAKTLRLTSDQLKELRLRKGMNTITFALSSSKAAKCTANIFVWDHTDRIVISDIDGTITKSDGWGHVYTMIGRDWTHMGVAKLYTDIVRNGYKIMYLTSRAIGQADGTRDYLKGINQGGYVLPEGPVILSPDRTMASLHREVIMRKPEVFKMACLRDIQRLFGNSGTPFYAGFGNRITDAMSYRSVNVPSDRIFTIDSSGEVKMELLELAGYKSSYIHMTDLVDQMFPPIHRQWVTAYTDFNYWRDPIAEIELPDFAPPSPALSATSDTSAGSRLSRLLRQGSRALPRPGTPTTPTTPGTPRDKSPDDGYGVATRSRFSRLAGPLIGQSQAPSVASAASTLGLSQGQGGSVSSFGYGRRNSSVRADSMSGAIRPRSMSNLSNGTSMPGSLPGSLDDSPFLDDHEDQMDEEMMIGDRHSRFDSDHDDHDEEGEDGDEDDDEDGEDGEGDVDVLLATGEMDDIPFL